MVAIATATTLRLNGFRFEPSTESFTAYRAPMPADGDLRELRRQRANDWIFYRREDELLAVPLHGAAAPFGEAIEVRCADQLGFLAFLIDEALRRAIPSYPAFKLRRSASSASGRRSSLPPSRTSASLGRFGMGLPNGALSCARRVEVFKAGVSRAASGHRASPSARCGA